MFRFKYAVIAAALLSVMAIAVACGDDAETDSSAQQSDVEALNARVERVEMMHAVIGLSKLGLHDMDVALQEGTIESSFSGNTRTAIRLLALTEWSPEFEDDAAAVEGHAVDLLRALEDEDLDAASAAALELHDTEHDFSAAVWAVLAADLAPDAGGVESHGDGDDAPADSDTEDDGHDGDDTEDGGHDDDAAETPAADATPE